ncbi:prepilin-type N-terminal cleavage/methylation domain-containing protein [Microbacterium sp. Marseille-Q6648]|uniref:prepilin-type N-terminal cleavage/methylation domain-containing protein n=1 Tax=Microbacterium sp. Marseille-Q6648 TaxID=2937991 RepID=UPI00203C685D|nr:prepilin-type N-terminal cleavage/methylation domain-containing protein [Microbacterium sp. Marseille-Q6648]
MRAFIKNYIAAEKARREEEGREAGFSLIELIVVVVILGILVAIAIPVFLNIQGQARDNAAGSVAATAATQAASQIAQGDPLDISNLDTGNVDQLEFVDASGDTAATVTPPTTIETICVWAVVDGSANAYAGPGC